MGWRHPSRRRLEAWFDGELPADLEPHVAVCPRCHGRLNEVGRIREVLRGGAGADAAADAAAGAGGRGRVVRASRVQGGHRSHVFSLAAAVAAGIAIALVATSVTTNPSLRLAGGQGRT